MGKVVESTPRHGKVPPFEQIQHLVRGKGSHKEVMRNKAGKERPREQLGGR